MCIVEIFSKTIFKTVATALFLAILPTQLWNQCYNSAPLIKKDNTMKTHQEIIEDEKKSIAFQREGKHRLCIEYCWKCYENYLALPKPNYEKAADCAHRVATSYAALAGTNQDPLCYLYAYESISCACQLEKNAHHERYRSHIIDLLYNKTKTTFKALADNRKLNAKDGENLLTICEKMLPLLNNAKELGATYHMLAQLNHAQTIARTPTENLLKILSDYLPRALYYHNAAINADPDNPFYKRQKVNFIDYNKKKYLTMIGHFENEQNYLIAIKLFEILFKTILSDKLIADQELANYHHAASNLYLKYKTTLPADNINERIDYSYYALQHARRAIELEPWNTHHSTQTIFSLDAYATSIKESNEQEAIELFQEAIQNILALPTKNQPLAVLEKCYENITWIYFKQSMNVSRPNKMEILKLAYSNANKAFEIIKSKDTANLVCKTSHAYACLLSESADTTEEAIAILEYISMLNEYYGNLDKMALVDDKIASINFHKNKLHEALPYFNKARNSGQNTSVLRHSAHQLTQTHYILAWNISYTSQNPEDYSTEIIFHYDAGIKLSLENHEERKAAIGYFGKGFHQFKYTDNQSEGLKNVFEAISILINDACNTHQFSKNDLFEQLSQRAIDANERLQQNQYTKQLTFDQQFFNAKIIYHEIRNWGRRHHLNKKRNPTSPHPLTKRPRR